MPSIVNLPYWITFEKGEFGVRWRQINRNIAISERTRDEVEAVFWYDSYVQSFRITSKSEIVSNPQKIALISSYWIISEVDKTIPKVPSYGVWRLAGYIHDSIPEVDIRVFDPNLFPSFETFRESFSQDSFDLVGMSVIPANIENDLKVLSLIREIQWQAMLIIWGIRSETLLDESIFSIINPEHLIIGPWEKAIERVIRNRIMKREDVSIPQVIQGERLDQQDMDFLSLLPFDSADLIHPSGYSSKIDYINTTNQCKLQCFWCSSPKDGPMFEKPEDVVDYIESIWMWPDDPVVFQDNDITYNPDFIRKVCLILRNRNIKNPKHAKATISGMETDFLWELQKAGFVRIAYGIESFDLEVRKKLWKGYQDEKISYILQETLDHWITPEINLILFSPFENQESLYESVREAISWYKKWASLFVTFWIHAVLGHVRPDLPACTKEIDFFGKKDSVRIPYIYETSVGLQSAMKTIQDNYIRYITDDPTRNNDRKSLIKLLLVARYFNWNAEIENLEGILQNQETWYINI